MHALSFQCSLFQSISHSVEVVPNCDDPLPWLAKQPRSRDEDDDKQEREEDTREATATPKPKRGTSEQIELQPIGQVALTVTQDPLEDGKKEEEKEELISLSEDDDIETPSLKQPPSETKVYPKLHLLQCGDTVCEFEFTLYEFVYEPPVTEAPPPPPSDTSSESEVTIEVEKDLSNKLNTEVDTPSISKLPKVENTETN